MPITPLAVTAKTLLSAAGSGCAAHVDALRCGRSGLRPNDFAPAAGIETWIGRVDGVEAVELPPALAAWNCRNNQLAEMALAADGFIDAAMAARERYGADRVALLVGTSTSGVLASELAYLHRREHGRLPAGYSFPHTQDIASLSEFLRRRLGLTGPAYTVSTACSSSAKVFADAHRLITAGICDAAVVGGADSLCLTTLCGFTSLELVSRRPCRPADAGRDGLSIGEAAGFALLERPVRAGQPALIGFGESSDAHHMSSPHPDGAGAQAAMAQALGRAGIGAGAVDYINLHGTATPSNDRAEDRAVHALFGDRTPCSSTKGWTGHTLGAAGIAEAVISLLCIEQGLLPGSLNTERLDPDLRSAVQLCGRSAPLERVLSNSFGFGGSNCSLLFGRTA